MTTLATDKIKDTKRFDIAELSQRLRKGIDESIGDMIVTVFVTAGTLLYMSINVNPVFLADIPGLFIFGMLVQLMIRIVQRFDANNTTDELADRIIEMEQSVNERLDEIIRNQYPL